MNAETGGREVSAAEMVASLPMYDLSELREAHDALWRALRQRLAAVGIARAPAILLRGGAGEEAWTDPRVLLTQVCGFPLASGLRGQVRVVATPAYRARGCRGPYHRSAVVVRRSDPATVLADARAYRVAVNAPDSNTGSNLLRAAVAPLGGGSPFPQPRRRGRGRGRRGGGGLRELRPAGTVRA